LGTNDGARSRVDRNPVELVESVVKLLRSENIVYVCICIVKSKKKAYYELVYQLEEPLDVIVGDGLNGMRNGIGLKG
jgi:hypothetical protein